MLILRALTPGLAMWALVCERLSAEEREALITAARESQTGCLADEECCYDSLDAMLPVFERILAARLVKVEALADE